MSDRYRVYRPLLDLLGETEGTDRGDGYNETLAYGRFTGGDVDLTGMTLDEVDALQTKMLARPENSWNSSAVGRYQIVQKTLRWIRDAEGLAGDALFDAATQDDCACFLLGFRGVDRWLAGRMTTDKLLTSLAQEWASLPTPDGTGYYGGQRAAVSPNRVIGVLHEVRARHQQDAPVAKVPVPVPKVERAAPDNIKTIAAGAATVLPAVAGLDWRVVVAGMVVGGALLGWLIWNRTSMARAAKDLRKALT